MPAASDVYEVIVSDGRPRARRWRAVVRHVVAAVSDGAFSGTGGSRSVRVLRRADGVVVLDEEGLHADVASLLVDDCATLGAEGFAERWL